MSIPKSYYDRRRTKEGMLSKRAVSGKYFGEEEYTIDPKTMKEFGLALSMETQALLVSDCLLVHTTICSLRGFHLCCKGTPRGRGFASLVSR
jgi:hypothetical protein